MELIRTGLRHKLPKGFSYPIGAEIISTALVGVPQFNDLWIGFSNSGWIPLLHGNLSNQDEFMNSLSAVLNFRSGGYYLSVPAVPSEHRRRIRDALVHHGLAEIKSWLAIPRSQLWSDGLRILQVGVSPDTGAVCVVEEKDREILGFRFSNVDD